MQFTSGSSLRSFGWRVVVPASTGTPIAPTGVPGVAGGVNAGETIEGGMEPEPVSARARECIEEDLDIGCEADGDSVGEACAGTAMWDCVCSGEK